MMCILDAKIIKQNIGGYLVFLILPKKISLTFGCFQVCVTTCTLKLKIEIRKQPTGNLLCP